MIPDQFRRDLFERFVAAFSESTILADKRNAAVKMEYATGLRYPLEKYANGKIPAGGKLLPSPPATNPYCYGLDKSDRPVYSRSEHTWNRVYWEGFYHYDDSVVEYIEFDLKHNTPVQVTRLLFENGRKTWLQFLKLNGFALDLALDGNGTKELVNKLMNNKVDIISKIERYHYENNRIAYAEGWSLYPGIGPESYKEVYSYKSSGQLKEIKTISEDGADQYRFVKSPYLTIEELSDQVATEIAKAVIEALAQTSFESPLAMVKLNYQEIGNYFPYVTVVTAAEQESILSKSSNDDLLVDLFILLNPEIPTQRQSFDRLLTALMNQVEDTDDYQPATAMIRKAANILTTSKLDGKVAVSEDFIAFAIDWSMAPDDQELAEIMLECGMSANTLLKWQEKGLFI
jgi:hypothetical protein